MVQNVPDRSAILLHPANQALKELKGCIAPVSKLDGHGIGSRSRKALKAFEDVCFQAIENEERIYLTIKKEDHMTIIERVKSPTPKFFRKLRNIGVALAAAGGAILAAPIALPAMVITIGGYLVTGGAVLTAVSQSTMEDVS